MLRAAIQPIDGAEKLVERGGRGKPDQLYPDPGFSTRLHLAADINLRGGIVADQHDAKPGRPPGGCREPLHVGHHRGVECGCDRGSVENARGHGAHRTGVPG